jgi:hypothetical protein
MANATRVGAFMIFWAAIAHSQPTYKVGDFAEMTSPKGAPIVVTVAAVLAEGYQVDFGESSVKVRADRLRPHTATLQETMLLLETSAADIDAFVWEADGQRVNPKFGTRECSLCPDRKTPPTAATAAQYFICDTERVRGNEIVLISNVEIALITPSSYEPLMDAAFPGIDQSEKVYQLVGSFDRFVCAALSPGQNAFSRTHNCTESSASVAAGRCWKNTSGDWHCTMDEPTQAGGSNKLAPWPAKK